jgi:hypothetical protein
MIIIVTPHEFDALKLLGTNDVICVSTEIELLCIAKDVLSYVIFHNCPIFQVPKNCQVFDINGLLSHLYGGSTNETDPRFARFPVLKYIHYKQGVLDKLYNCGYHCLLENISFAIRFRDAKFREVFWLWCENHVDYVIRLFCNPGFVLHIENLEFSIQLDKICKLLSERHFHQAMNHICTLVSNFEFCVNLTNPNFFIVFEMLNQMYPLGDVLTMFTCRGFCNQIVNPVFYLYFQKFRNPVPLFSSFGFISNILQPGYFDHVQKIFHQFKSYDMFTCQAFCLKSREFQEQMNELVRLFGIEKTIVLLKSEVISKHILDCDFFSVIRKVISIFGTNCCKLLSKSYEYLRTRSNDEIVQSWVNLFGTSKTSKLLRNSLLIQNLTRVKEFVNLLTIDKVYQLLRKSIAFVARIESDVFFKQVESLRKFHSINTLYTLLLTTHICVKIEDSEFSNDLHRLLVWIGDYHACQFLCDEHFENRMKDWKQLCKLVLEMNNANFLFTCFNFRFEMLYGDFQQVLFDFM